MYLMSKNFYLQIINYDVKIQIYLNKYSLKILLFINKLISLFSIFIFIWIIKEYKYSKLTQKILFIIYFLYKKIQILKFIPL